VPDCRRFINLEGPDWTMPDQSARHYLLIYHLKLRMAEDGAT
jgi:hypothetical protein